jgi:hypothetical protein
MVVSKVQKQAKRNIVDAPQTSLSSRAAILPDALPSQETARIGERAYELYEVGGRKPGHDEQGRLRAEQEILNERV